MTKPRGPDFWNNPDDPRHGTVNGYSNHKCRCDRCRANWTRWHREYMHRGDNLERHAHRQMERLGRTRKREYAPRPRKNEDGEWDIPERKPVEPRRRVRKALPTDCPNNCSHFECWKIRKGSK